MQPEVWEEDTSDPDTIDAPAAPPRPAEVGDPADVDRPLLAPAPAPGAVRDGCPELTHVLKAALQHDRVPLRHQVSKVADLVELGLRYQPPIRDGVVQYGLICRRLLVALDNRRPYGAELMVAEAVVGDAPTTNPHRAALQLLVSALHDIYYPSRMWVETRALVLKCLSSADEGPAAQDGGAA